MRYATACLVCLLLLSGCASGRKTSEKATPDVASLISKPEETRPRFYAETLNVLSSDSTGKAKIIVFLAVPRSDLLFTTHRVNDTTKYRASISWEVKLSYGGPVGIAKDASATEYVSREMLVGTYKETQIGLAVDQAAFYVTAPTTCSLEVILTDENTKRSKKITYHPIGARFIKDGEFNLTDPFPFLRAFIDSSSVQLMPLDSRRVDPSEQVPFVTVVYYPPKGQQIWMNYQLRKGRGEIIFETSQALGATEKDWMFDTLFVKLPETAENGEYALSATARNEDGTQSTFTANRAFTIYSVVLRNAEEFDEAARQMINIPRTEKVIKQILKAETVPEKKRLWLDFWKRMDPVPERALALMKEYYQRVVYTNSHFGGSRLRGWATDRGKVYCRFGPPNDVERHPFELDSYPYEVWHYYGLPPADNHHLRSLGYKYFVFIAKFGDFSYTFGDLEIYSHNMIEFNN